MELVFSDGVSTVVDFQPFLKGPLFEPLKDPVYFARARLDPVAGTLVWPNGADFDPDSLYPAAQFQGGPQDRGTVAGQAPWHAPA